jgi:hypothetical protein
MLCGSYWTNRWSYYSIFKCHTSIRPAVSVYNILSLLVFRLLKQCGWHIHSSGTVRSTTGSLLCNVWRSQGDLIFKGWTSSSSLCIWPLKIKATTQSQTLGNEHPLPKCNIPEQRYILIWTMLHDTTILEWLCKWTAVMHGVAI